jgi:hypothetical protein
MITMLAHGALGGLPLLPLVVLAFIAYNGLERVLLRKRVYAV